MNNLRIVTIFLMVLLSFPLALSSKETKPLQVPASPEDEQTLKKPPIAPVLIASEIQPDIQLKGKEGKFEKLPDTVAGTPQFSPLTLRTGPLTYTGRGGEANVQPFAPVQIRTGTITYTGRSGEANVQPFAPVQIRTGTLTYTGTAR